MKRPLSPAKLLLLTASVGLVVACGGIVVFVAVSQRANFQEYAPTKLPAGVTMGEGQLYVQRKKGLWPSFRKHINIHFNQRNSWLAEWKSTGKLTNPCGPRDPSCQAHTTPKGQSFQLAAHTETSGRYTYNVRFIKDRTELWITLREYPGHLPPETWAAVVDSFRPHRFTDLTIIHSSPGP